LFFLDRIGQLVDICYRKGGEKATVILSDRLKDIGTSATLRPYFLINGPIVKN
jgi:hypothetical protein